MRRESGSRMRLHLKWAVLTVAIALAAVGVHARGARDGSVGGRTAAGRALGFAGLALVAFAAGYGIRKRKGAAALADGVARRDPERVPRLERLRDRIASLQAAHARGELPADRLRAAAAAVVAEAGFRGEVEVRLAAAGPGASQVRVLPRLHPGRRENWLVGHQYLNLLVLPLTWLHHPTTIREPFGWVLVCLAVGTVATGACGCLIHVAVPRILLRLESPGGPSRLAPALEVLLRGWSAVHLGVSALFALALLVHVLARL